MQIDDEVEKLNIPDICSKLDIAGSYNIHLKQSVSSTNNWAREFWKKHSSSNQIEAFLSESQNQGRGRWGRHFYSPSQEGIYLSVLIPVSNNVPPGLWTTGAAVATIQALTTCIPNADFKLKWVNDILVNNHKCGGILTEALLDSNEERISGVIIGIGLDVFTQQFPLTLNDKATKITSDYSISRNRLIASVLNNLYTSMIPFPNEAHLSQYRSLCTTLNQQVIVRIGDQQITGVAQSINAEGSLVMATSKHEEMVISSGEVEKVIPAKDVPKSIVNNN